MWVSLFPQMHSNPHSVYNNNISPVWKHDHRPTPHTCMVNVSVKLVNCCVSIFVYNTRKESRCPIAPVGLHTTTGAVGLGCGNMHTLHPVVCKGHDLGYVHYCKGLQNKQHDILYHVVHHTNHATHHTHHMTHHTAHPTAHHTTHHTPYIHIPTRRLVGCFSCWYCISSYTSSLKSAQGMGQSGSIDCKKVRLRAIIRSSLSWGGGWDM